MTKSFDRQYEVCFKAIDKLFMIWELNLSEQNKILYESHNTYYLKQDIFLRISYILGIYGELEAHGIDSTRWLKAPNLAFNNKPVLEKLFGKTEELKEVRDYLYYALNNSDFS